MNSKNYLLPVIIIAFLFSACKKKEDAKLPTVSFKGGAGYVSGNTDATKNAILNVGIIADKNEADLRRVDVKVKYSYLTSESTKKTFYVDDSEVSHFEKDYEIKTATQNGKETWTFEATDKDGNIGSNKIDITVQ